MYQGKFANKNKGGQKNQQTETRSTMPQYQASSYEEPEYQDPQQYAQQWYEEELYQSQYQQPQRQAPRQAQRPAPRQQPQQGQRPAAARRPAPQQPRRPAPQQPQRPMPQQAAPVVQEAPRKKSHVGGLIFYTIFFLVIFVFYTCVFFGLQSLQDWLVRYEAAQPTKKSQEIFQMYFEDPNWGLLYDNAGVEKSAYEGKEAFVTYMEDRVGDTPLNLLETSAGLSKDKKYIVRLGDEKIASFTLTDRNQAEGVADIPDWQLGKIELFYQRSETYWVETLEGYTTKVNGVALDETANVRVGTNKAGEYLPEGINPPTTYTQEISGLMAKPEVTVTDASGKPVEVQYDETDHTFRVPALAKEEIPQEEKETALEAIKTYAVYMSSKSGGDEKLAKYFKRGTPLHKTITGMERTWNQSFKDYEFTDESVTDYVRYTDDLFSARVKVTLHLNRKDGTEKVTDVDQSMFFSRENGSWKCYDMTAVDVMEPVEKVRITFRNGDTVLSTELYDTGVKQIQCPLVTAPEGKTFSGWVMEELKDSGDRVMRVMLTPDESGLAAAPADGLRPMNLTPLFE